MQRTPIIFPLLWQKYIVILLEIIKRKGLQREKRNIYQWHSSAMYSWQHCKIWCSFICACACLCGGARPSTPRPALEESPLISTRIGEEPVRDVTSPLPLSLNLHFLWVLGECTCVLQTLSTLAKGESRGHTSDQKKWSRVAPMWPEALCHLKY